jgi:hypothetical protein
MVHYRTFTFTFNVYIRVEEEEYWQYLKGKFCGKYMDQ